MVFAYRKLNISQRRLWQVYLLLLCGYLREKNPLLFKINDLFRCWRFFKSTQHSFIAMLVLGWSTWLFIVLILFHVVCPDNLISIAPFAHFRIIRIHFWPTGSKRHFVRLILWKVCCPLSVFHCVSTCYIIEWEFNVSHNAVPIERVPLLYKNRTPSYYKYSKRIWCFVLC